LNVDPETANGIETDVDTETTGYTRAS